MGSLNLFTPRFALISAFTYINAAHLFAGLWELVFILPNKYLVKVPYVPLIVIHEKSCKEELHSRLIFTHLKYSRPLESRCDWFQDPPHYPWNTRMLRCSDPLYKMV